MTDGRVVSLLFRRATWERHQQLGSALEDSTLLVTGGRVQVFSDDPVLRARLAEPFLAEQLRLSAVDVLGCGARVSVEAPS